MDSMFQPELREMEAGPNVHEVQRHIGELRQQMVLRLEFLGRGHRLVRGTPRDGIHANEVICCLNYELTHKYTMLQVAHALHMIFIGRGCYIDTWFFFLFGVLWESSSKFQSLFLASSEDIVSICR